MSATLYDKVFDATRCAASPAGQYQLLMGLHLIHEVTSPQAFSMLRDRGLTASTPSARSPRWTTSSPPIARAPAGRSAGRGDAPAPRAQLRGARHPLLRTGQRRAGHRARDRTGAGPHAARDDDLLRRLAHLDARRLRRHRLRHRDVAGPGRPRHAVSRDGSPARPPHRGERPPASGRVREGRHPLDHQPPRRPGRRRLRVRVRRRRLRPLLDGGADDRLQHVDRGRRALRIREPGPDDLRVPARARLRAGRRGLGPCGRLLGLDALGSGRTIRRRRAPARRGHRAGRHVGHHAGAVDAHRGRPARSRTVSRRGASVDQRGLPVHAARARQAHPRNEDRRRLHRVVHQRAHLGLRSGGAPARGPRRPRRAAREGARGAGIAARARGAGPARLGSRVPGRRLRLPRSGLLHVSRHEPRQARGRAALRVVVESQLQGAAGLADGPHAADVAGHGGGMRHRRRGDRRRELFEIGTEDA